MKRVLLVFLVACGGGSGSNSDTPMIDAPDDPVDGAIDAPMGAFTLTSPSYAEGGTIPNTHSCDGTNTSPQLVWPAGPAGTLSYAVVFTDKSTTPNPLIHWAIWDIPATPLGVPANIQKMFMPNNVVGAKQTSFQGGTKGYLGPCPPSGTTHTYEHVVYAIDIASLPGTTNTTTPAQAKAIIEMHDLTTAQLSAMYTRP